MSAYWRWLWEAYNETSEEVAGRLFRWFQAKWYRTAGLGAIEAVILAGLWRAGAL